jgi:exonuclease SbcD
MSLSIFLTSDLHLGMKFASLPDVQAELAEARFLSLQRLVETANGRRAELLIVAGDLFERIGMPKKDVRRAAAMFAEFQGLSCVLPGNHDYLSPDDELWKRFKEVCGDRALVLEEPRPYPLTHFGVNACLYPGPCVSKHSKSNAVSWVKGAPRDPGIRHHLGVAHGSLEGFSPDFAGDYYPMKVSELLSTGLDLWLLGHTHVPYPNGPAPSNRIFFSGTPEPDGFDCAHDGFCRFLGLDDAGRVTDELIRTGSYRFLREEIEVRSLSDLAGAEKRWAGMPDASRLLLKASIRGRLPPQEYPEIERIRKNLARTLFRVELNSEGVRAEITRGTIDAEYPVGSFPHSLLVGLASSGDAEALEIAYELLEEARR